MRNSVKGAFSAERGVSAGLAFFSLWLFTSSVAKAQMGIRPFSADEIHTIGKRTTTGKVYFNEKAFRTESEEKGKKRISILRLDRQVMWIVMPDQKTYLEMGGIGSGVAEMASSMEGAKIERESLGAEQVGAYHCDKYRVQVTYQGKVYTSLEWDAKELHGFAVKRADEKGGWSTEYQNVHIGSQDPSLFEVPEGYKKLSFGGMPIPH